MICSSKRRTKKVVMDTQCVNSYCVQTSCTLNSVTCGRSTSNLWLRAFELELVESEEDWEDLRMVVSPRQALLWDWGAGLDLQRANRNHFKAALEFGV